MQNNKHNNLILFIGWMMFVTFSSLYAFKGSGVTLFHIEHGDKLVHFMFYFIGAVLGLRFLSSKAGGTMLKNALLLKLSLFLIVYGIIIEVLQETLTQSRTGDFYDALANSVGAICGVFIVNALFYRQRGLK